MDPESVGGSSTEIGANLLEGWRATAGDPDWDVTRWLTADGVPAVYASVETDDVGWAVAQCLVGRGWLKQFESFSELRLFLGQDPVLCRFGIVSMVKSDIVNKRLIFQESVCYLPRLRDTAENTLENTCLVSRSMFSTCEVLMEFCTNDPGIVVGGSQATKNEFLGLVVLAGMALGLPMSWKQGWSGTTTPWIGGGFTIQSPPDRLVVKVNEDFFSEVRRIP